MENAAPLRYRITPIRPEAHLFEVVLTIPTPAPTGQRVALPAWIPGSYMIREFSRNIVTIEATCRGKPVTLTKLDKHTWAAERCEGALIFRCEIYAWDLSVRAAHLDQTHGFFNGTSVFPRVPEFENAPHEVEILPPKGRAYAGWKVATTLPCARGTALHGFGLYRAANYDELVDHPVEMGCFTLVKFSACGVPHEMAITGKHDCDTRRLAADLKKICETQIHFFHGRNAGPKQVPFKRYVFQTMAVGDGYGGLEHRASTALICNRNDLPHAGMDGVPEGYRTFLGLCSHEYFHTWNVKRIKPAAFAPYDLTQENYTRLLWAFEGFTSYYDDLMLVRAGVIDDAAYFSLLAKTIQGVLRGSGRLKQTVAESSFDAWTKYYRQDENAPNAIVSYYTKGSLVALCLDLLLRSRTDGSLSLDDVMRHLWRHYGAHFETRGTGVPEDGLLKAAIAVAPGMKRVLGRFFDTAVNGTADLPLKVLLGTVGLDLVVDKGSKPALGARTASAGDGVRLTHVLDNGGAQAAGLSAGDVVVAVDGIKVTNGTLDALLVRRKRGATIRVHAFRRDEMIEREVTLGLPELTAELKAAKDVPAPAARLRRAWIQP
jgi:predicted metalloprotease with PDZ domain